MGVAEQAAGHDGGSAARRVVCAMVKARARAYGRRPAALEMLHPGLSTAAPTAMVALSRHLVEREQASPRRWFGFGGEVGLVNARAALLLGRAKRRRSARAREAGKPEPLREAGVCRPSQANETGTT